MESRPKVCVIYTVVYGTFPRDTHSRNHVRFVFVCGTLRLLRQDSYKYMQAGMLSDARFLQSIFAFSQNEKDFINDETVEFMAPYLELEGFNPAVARNASKAAEGLCTWCRAMTYYHEASKVRYTYAKKWVLDRSALDAFYPTRKDCRFFSLKTK